MKKILLAAAIVGAATAGVIIYMREFYRANQLEDAAEDAGHAAHDAYHTMDRHIRQVENRTIPVLN